MTSKWFIVFASVLVALAVPPVAQAEVNRIVLRVNDRILTLFDYEQVRDERMAAVERADLDDRERQRLLAQAGETTLREQFEEMLLLARADALGIEISQQDLAQAVEQAKTGFGFESEEQFQAALVQNRMTEADFTEQIRRNLVVREVLGRDVHSKIALEEEDLRRYYSTHQEEFRVPVLLDLEEVVVLESAFPTAAELEEAAAALRREIVEGRGEEAVAASQAAGRSTGWIDLGRVEIADLDDQLRGAVETLAPGEVSEPTAARGGLHLLKLAERTEAGVRAFEEVRAEIERIERDRRFRRRMQDYMHELVDDSFIVADPPAEAADFRRGMSAPADPLDEAFRGPRPAAPAASDGAS